ncbi:MAG: hypothetical protein NTZ90_13070 [Proteobacteria bacterium]|nr:hypothetical protein [Pseudomonadota bacterium]
MTDASLAADPRILSLMNDTAIMMDELSRLSRKLGELGKEQEDNRNGHDVVAELQDHFRAFSERMKDFSEESRRTISGLDNNVHSNPYVFILCALGLGFLLGKAMRSSGK